MKYIVRKNPNDNKWYALGHVGDNQWMPVSDGYNHKKQAPKIRCHSGRSGRGCSQRNQRIELTSNQKEVQ